MAGQETYSTLEEMVTRFRTPTSTWYKWRSQGEGPRAIKVGRKLLYPESAVQEWLQTLEEGSEPAAVGGV